MNVQRIVGSIVKNQASGGKWLMSEANVYTMRFYIYCSVDEVDDVLKVDLHQMVEEKDGLAESRQLIRNLEDTHNKIQESVKIKLAK